jgi:hypothetical protein
VVFVRKLNIAIIIMRTFRIASLVLILFVLAISCRKIEQLPDEPSIEFTSFAVFDTTDLLGNDCKGGRLKFYFEDGDGDLGFDEPLQGQTDTSNLFLKLFRETGGTMVEITDTNDLMRPSNYRIPYLERIGQNKILKGTIAVTFVYTFYNPADSGIFRYDFYIKDRAEHHSDTISTCNIPLSINDLYTN